MVEPDQPIAIEKTWEMNDEDDDIDCEEVTLVVGEHSRGSNNIFSLRSSVVDQNDVSEEPIKGLRDGSIGGAIDDNVGGEQLVGYREVHVDGSVGQNVDDNARGGQPVGCEEVHVDGSIGGM